MLHSRILSALITLRIKIKVTLKQQKHVMGDKTIPRSETLNLNTFIVKCNIDPHHLTLKQRRARVKVKECVAVAGHRRFQKQCSN